MSGSLLDCTSGGGLFCVLGIPASPGPTLEAREHALNRAELETASPGAIGLSPLFAIVFIWGSANGHAPNLTFFTLYFFVHEVEVTLVPGVVQG